MDYKYIEQLLERYWEARTTTAEEQILRSFFSQSELPAHLASYRTLFDYQSAQQEIGLGEDFDARLLSLVDAGHEKEEKPLLVKMRRPTWRQSLHPLFQAAAGVAIVVLISLAAGHSFSESADKNTAWDYNPASYNDTYTNPQQAYHVVADGLEMFQRTASADTLGQAPTSSPTAPEE